MLQFCRWVILLATGCCLLGNSTNLLVNGDFSQGDVGFATNYAYSATTCVPEGSITVGSNPLLCNPSAPSFGDHTTGSGLMLIANGALTPGVVAWQETVSVQDDQNYAFIGWDSNWANNAVPGEALSHLLLMINGSVLTAFSPNFTNGVWTQFSAQWNSGNASSAVIQIADTTAIALGDDFALDDLSFGLGAVPVPEPSSLTLLGTALACLSLLRFRRPI
jgi:PEP-CTERM motif